MSSPTQTPQNPPPPQVPPRYYYARRRSVAGPIVLIALGVLFLLGNIHVLTWPMLGTYFARYWPVLIILWGVIKLFEHWNDTRQGLPGRGIGAGGVLLIIFLIIFGMSATAAYKVNWNAFGNNVDFDNDFAGLFGNTYSFTQTVEQPFTTGDTVHVVDDRGNVTINAWDEPKIKVVVNKRVIASDDKESNDIDQKTQATIITGGNVANVSANTLSAGRRPVESNLQIWVPEKAAVDLAIGRGDVTVATRKGDVHINTVRGDLTAQQITGDVTLASGRGSVRAQDIQGDVAINGRVSDSTVHDVTGSLTLSGDFFGEMDLARIAKGVSFHSARTTMEMSALPGDLTMESGDLRVRSVTGPMRVMTRSKDIHIEDVAGDLKIENTNGLVEYHAGNKLGAIDITNSRGDVQLTLPEKSSFQVEAQARRGDVSTDFEGVSTSEQHNDHAMSGTVGKGGPTIRISDTSGDISLRKGNAPAPPENAAAPGSLPPDKTLTPGGGISKPGELTPPRAPKAAKPPRAPEKQSQL
ncbi:MAG: DUF4097 family beta strand repeat-containing protein [Terriglobales bacterium]